MSTKPTLTLSTPVTANFPNIPPPPAEARSAVSLPSAVSERTPLSAISRTSAFREPFLSAGLPSAGLPSAGPLSATVKIEQDLLKTPITPPVAYIDFLKAMSIVSPSIASPPQTGRAAMHRTSTASSTLSNTSTSSSSSTSANSDDSEKEKGEQIESAPSTARSELSCECNSKDTEKDLDKEKDKDKNDEAETKREKTKSPRPAPIDTTHPKTPRGSSTCPLSAPAAGMFPSMKVPASPAVSVTGIYSPRSPLSAASVRSPFDWDAALRSRRFADTPGSKRPATQEPPTSAATTATTPGGGHAKKESRSSIRHIREVVTRTVTYTPRMAPAPKGKRRKLDPEASVKS